MEFRLVNMMQELVQQELDSVLSHYPDVCRCERCLLDIQALALNHLTPHYVVSQQGEVYAKIEYMSLQRQIDVQSALTKAVHIVKERPRH